MSIGYDPLKRYQKTQRKSNNNSHLGGLPEFLEWTAPAAVGTCFGGDPKMLPLGGPGRWVRKWEMGPPIQGHNRWRMRKMTETFRVIDVWPHLWCDVTRSSSWSDNPIGIFQRGAATFSVPCKLTQSKNQWKIPSCRKSWRFPMSHSQFTVSMSVSLPQFTPRQFHPPVPDALHGETLSAHHRESKHRGATAPADTAGMTIRLILVILEIWWSWKDPKTKKWEDLEKSHLLHLSTLGWLQIITWGNDCWILDENGIRTSF